MDLQQLKKEVRELPRIEQAATQFQEHWLKPIRTNGNYRFSFLERLDAKTEKDLKRKLAEAQFLCKELKSSQPLHEKLLQYSRYLIELKLTPFRGDEKKSRILLGQLLNDEYLRLSITIAEIRQNERRAQQLEQQYQDINALLDKHFSLEESLFFLELPHAASLRRLLDITEKQKMIIRGLGKHLVAIAKEKKVDGQRITEKRRSS